MGVYALWGDGSFHFFTVFCFVLFLDAFISDFGLARVKTGDTGVTNSNVGPIKVRLASLAFHTLKLIILCSGWPQKLYQGNSILRHLMPSLLGCCYGILPFYT